MATTNDFSDLSPRTTQDPPHRAVSREPAHHNVTMAALGVVCAAAVLGVMWLFYAFG